MNDYENLKSTFDVIGVEYEAIETLLGYSIAIQAGEQVIYFEFNEKGQFLNVLR